MKHRKKIFFILLLISLLSMPAYSYAYVIPNYDNGMTEGTKYTINRFPDTTDYYYHDTWPVFLQGDTISPTATPRGYMMLQKPQDINLSNLGRTFAAPVTVRDWAEVFNGNPDFVEDYFYNNHYRSIIDQKTKREYLMAYSRDIARKSGAEIDTGSFGIPDGKGGIKGYVLVSPTPYPKGQISVPSTVNVGDSVNIVLSGQEFNPYDDIIKWSFSIDGQSIQSGTVYTSTLNKTISKTFDKPGTYTLKLTVTDQVERTGSVTKTITVIDNTGGGGGGTPPSDGGGGSCEAPYTPPPRYSYELDLAVNKIEGQTVERGTNTSTPVEVYRKDYSAKRDQIKNEIQQDIDTRKAQKAQYESELNTLQSQLSDLQSQLSKAEEGYLVDVCETVTGEDGKPTQECHKERQYDTGLINSLKSQIAQKQKEIETKECQIQNKQIEIDHFQKELDDLKQKESQFATVDTNVVLQFNGSQKGSQPVSLKEGETKTLYFSWPLPDNGTIKAEINPSRNPEEVTYTNNSKSTPIYIATHDVAACAAPGDTSSASGIVRTITTDAGTQVLREYVTMKLTNQSNQERRAGYGFSYDIETTYSNEDPKSSATGPNKTLSYFPTLPNYLPYKDNGEGYEVPMDVVKNTSGSTENKTWNLPRVWVEQFSGNIFDSQNPSDSRHNPQEKMLDGGRKWYLNFDQKDGLYKWHVKSFNAGVNQLTTCVNGQVTVKGSYIGDPNGNDDFIKRSVAADNPFPGGVGWNWKGFENMLTNLTDWYRHWFKSPDETPDAGKFIKLDIETIKELKKYNKDHDYKVQLNDDFKNTFSSLLDF